MRTVFVWFFSFVVCLLLPIFYLMAMILPKVRSFAAMRFQALSRVKEIIKEKSTDQRSVVVFCSSAGEYEQARPIIDRLKSRGFFCLIVFFSPSGVRFIESRNDGTPYILSPFDAVWVWQKIFALVGPEITIVVRHEFWPAFLSVAAKNSKLYLVNLSRPQDSKNISILKRIFLRWFDDVYVIAQTDQNFYCKYIETSKVHIVGDTKYDRVIERAIQNENKAEMLKQFLDEKFAKRQKIIIGSAWPADVKVSLDANLRVARDLDQSWLMIIVPHEVDTATIESIESECRNRRLATVRFSQIGDPLDEQLKLAGVLIVDQLGKLAEFYSVANLCFVGGALHHKIHNVLEPAAYGLTVAHGPLYHSQQEAVDLVDGGYTTVVHNEENFAAWWLRSQNISHQEVDRLKNRVRALSGAAERIINHWQLV